jgi:hypothetical protein
VQHDLHSALGELPRGLAASEASSDDVDRSSHAGNLAVQGSPVAAASDRRACLTPCASSAVCGYARFVDSTRANAVQHHLLHMYRGSETT